MRAIEAQCLAPDEAALLITCLRGLPFVVDPDTDWRALLRLAETHGVLPLVHQSLLNQSVEIPDFFAAAVRESREAASMFAAELESLLKEFAERDIEVLALKGPVLGAMLYGDVTTRSCNDLDVLVRGGDYQRSETLLLDMGFIACSTPDDYHRRFLRSGVPVELHFDIASPRHFPFGVDGVWNRSRVEDFRGTPMRVMSDDELVLFLCLHGLKHGFSRLIWILDVAKALQKLRHGNYEELVRRAQSEGLEPWLLIGCEVVRAMFPQQLPREMDVVIARSPEVAERAHNVAAKLFAEGLETVNDHKIRGFYLQTERSARKRWRCRLSHFVPTAQDYQWAERHRVARGLMPILRPLRLLRKYGPSRAWRFMFPPTG